MKNRIRNISIGFLVMLLIFTFLSRVLASVTTAVVATQKAVSGKISHSVSAMGKVDAVQEKTVTLPGQRVMEKAMDANQQKVIVTISAEYGGYFSVGDSVILKKYGETDAIPGAELTNIKYDEDAPDFLNMTVTITGAGLELGELVEVTFDKQSEQYGMLIPIDAIRWQNNETYVLIVQEAEGILGTVLEARKVIVDILDKNSSYAAISAVDVSGQDIIIQSNRAVKDGSRVRKQVP